LSRNPKIVKRRGGFAINPPRETGSYEGCRGYITLVNDQGFRILMDFVAIFLLEPKLLTANWMDYNPYTPRMSILFLRFFT
jgi:hypothetical protein